MALLVVGGCQIRVLGGMSAGDLLFYRLTSNHQLAAGLLELISFFFSRKTKLENAIFPPYMESFIFKLMLKALL